MTEVPAFSKKEVAIMAAAEKLFAEKGFDGTSVRDIALEADVNVAMISYYFGSKEKLMETIITYRISASSMMLEGLLHDKELTPVEKVTTMVDNYVDRMMLHPHYQKIIMRAQMSDEHTASHTLLTEVKMRNLELIRKLIGEGVRKKVFSRYVDVPMMMTTMFGTFYQLISNSEFYRKAAGMMESTDEIFQLTLRKRLKAHLKHILLASLTYEVNA